MSPLPPLELAATAGNALLALVWAILARHGWRALGAEPSRSASRLLLPLVTASLAAIYFTGCIFNLIPLTWHAKPPPLLALLYTFNDLAVIATASMFLHLTHFFSLRDEPPSRRWLARNYGAAAVTGALTLAGASCFPAPDAPLRRGVTQVVLWLYVLVVIALGARRLSALARGTWRPGGSPMARRPDALILAGSTFFVALTLVFLLTGGWGAHRTGLSVLATLLGFALVTPFAVRALGEVVRSTLQVVAVLGMSAAVLGGAAWTQAHVGEPRGLGPLLVLLAAAGLAIVLGPLQDWLRQGLEHALFRRNRDRRTNLQRAVHELSPELGRNECCRRGLAELVRILRLRGAAILLRDGADAVAGELDTSALAATWPRHAEADRLVERAIPLGVLGPLPLAAREALLEAGVVAVQPIAGPERLWGHLLITTSLLASTFPDEDRRAIATFADQLALLLDGADLLARVVDVERSLAHAEKLAAIGELAARVAHEIRNPVTAARSLAQLLVRDPTSPLNAEHAGLILTELERVERQVAALLRFARRDELRLEPVDLGALVGDTVDALRPRLESACVGASVDAPPGVVVGGDREKLRQVLINLLENALDALAARPGERRLAIAVAAANGHSTLRVSDNGPGVPAEARPRLFEPFFSLKGNGTGLGLAIVKRIVEGHSGQVAFSTPPGGGACFAIDLPLAPVP